VFDAAWRAAWNAYRDINSRVADAVAEVTSAHDDAVVLVQDYHLALVGRALADRGVTVPVVHFSHTPFAGAEGIGVLPADVGREVLDGMAAFTACGFHTERWATRFRAACAELDVDAPTTFTADLAPDVSGVRAVAGGGPCALALDALEQRVGRDRRVVGRVDRRALSKNVLRGFLAYEALLDRRPDLRGEISFAACLYRSREGVEDYRVYEQQVVDLAARINGRFAVDGWEPIVLQIGDDFPRSVAALRRYDVLLVNPVRDGLNLVAFEGPAVNERDGIVCLSTEAGAFDSLAGAVERLDPFDIESTADALERALEMPMAARQAMAERLRERAGARTPSGWLDAQLAAACG
jgi:trehalose 6-phosphate synthase